MKIYTIIQNLEADLLLLLLKEINNFILQGCIQLNKMKDFSWEEMYDDFHKNIK